MQPTKIFHCWHFSIAIMSMLLLTSSHLNAAETKSYQEIDWIQLMPSDDLDALLNPPEYLNDIADGSEQDSLDSLSLPSENPSMDRFQQALSSERVIPEFDKKAVRIPGYMVPLVSDEQQNVTEFFIVPYFGACMHMPPPPPNQMIYGKLPKGFKLTELTEAFWFEGTIHIETTNNMTGTSAYAMSIDKIEIYE
ncbi:DUF3299 domain-containing protein [Paraglaciecola aquimarina]|uniref:DUF3299 domain-containing protein n=1 Tax=Paraglaciecola aquimarina TaxID=1235557 RepID=A0ABU3SUR8_9ALTE|nr:DUF3299 domain-containing protein [Paraglaciecola aquimarina]MDU0353737.1 DUF3299 domain-containing protein [Paraglaciecola aquimarina]